MPSKDEAEVKQDTKPQDTKPEVAADQAPKVKVTPRGRAAIVVADTAEELEVAMPTAPADEPVVSAAMSRRTMEEMARGAESIARR